MLQQARKAIEETYSGTATVSGYQKVRDEKTKLMKSSTVTILENQPCRLSFEKISQVAQTGTVANIAQQAKLFISPDVTIKPGSKITITQNEVTGDYTYSGVPAIYPTHQEIMLDLYEERA